ncbi:hypothetical protein ACFV9D_23960 [Streptomyces sp. NPDC059875]
MAGRTRAELPLAGALGLAARAAAYTCAHERADPPTAAELGTLRP